MQCVEMVSAVSLGNRPVRVVQLPLTACRTGVVARCRLGIHTELRHYSHAHIVVVKIAADTKLCQLHFAVAKHLTRPADGVVLRMIEAVVVIHIGTNLWSKEACSIRRLFSA